MNELHNILLRVNITDITEYAIMASAFYGWYRLYPILTNYLKRKWNDPDFNAKFGEEHLVTDKERKAHKELY